MFAKKFVGFFNLVLVLVFLSVLNSYAESKKVAPAVVINSVSRCCLSPRSSNNYINIEAKNVESVYKKIMELSQKYNCVLGNFNTSKDYCNIIVCIPKENQAAFLNDLSKFSKIISQNFSDNSVNIESLQRKLEIYKKYLKKILGGDVDPEIMQLIYSQFQSLQNQVDSAIIKSGQSDDMMSLQINVQKKRCMIFQNAYFNQIVPILIILVIVLLLIASFVVLIYLGINFLKKQKIS